MQQSIMQPGPEAATDQGQQQHRGRGSHGSAPCHISSLPENLLLEVLKLLPFWNKRVVCPLVCRAWCQLCRAPELWEQVLLDFPTECLPMPTIYPEHQDQPYVDITAVGRWLAARCLQPPGVRELALEVRHSRTFQNPAFEAGVAMEITSQDFAALLGTLAPRLVSLRVEACDDLLSAPTLGALWCLSMLRRLSLHDLAYPVPARTLNKALRHLSRLERLELDCHAFETGWGLEGFPHLLCTLPALRVLRLVNQHGVWVLPISLSRLAGSLRQLMLRDCGVQSLPPSMSALTALTALVVEGVLQRTGAPLQLGGWLTALSSLQRLLLTRSLQGSCPPEAGALCALRTLDLSHNALGALPVEYSGLTSLEDLNLSSNHFESCPEVLTSLRNLRRLDLYANRLGAGPAASRLQPLPHLTWLDLSRNRLQSLPPALASCTALAHLVLGGNAVAGPLPCWLSSLTGLEVLGLRKNALKEVPAALAGLPWLRQLILDGNPVHLDDTGVEVLLNLPRLWRLSARIKPLPVPPPPQPAALPSQFPAQGFEPGPGGGRGPGGLERHLMEQREAQHPAAGASAASLPAAPGELRPQGGAGAAAAAQQRMWRQLAERLALQHGHTVLNLEGA